MVRRRAQLSARLRHDLEPAAESEASEHRSHETSASHSNRSAHFSASRDSSCGTVDVIATEHLTEVDRKIADLTALRRELADAVKSCRGGTVAECRILEAFSPAMS